ncbi:MAG: hypothetical protein C0407_18085 [Desulfobacca sp.]|nr:hypothetical protein [Desulfobacca sp.]
MEFYKKGISLGDDRTKVFRWEILSPLTHKKGEKMAEIKWEKMLDAALIRAKGEKKPVFLDFFNPG